MKKDTQFRDVIRPLINYYKSDLITVITNLYKQGKNQSDVARLLEVSRQAVSIQYPKSKLLKEREKND